MRTRLRLPRPADTTSLPVYLIVLLALAGGAAYFALIRSGGHAPAKPTITAARGGPKDAADAPFVAEAGPRSGGTPVGDSPRFSVTGRPRAGAVLYPGAPAVPLDLVFANPNAAAITVRRVTVSVTGTSVPDCSAANFTVAQQLQAGPTVPGGATASLEDLGVEQSDWPQLRMLDAGNQDACRNATVQLSFSGTAAG